MYHPTHIDGCSIVILRQKRGGFRVLELDFGPTPLGTGRE